MDSKQSTESPIDRCAANARNTAEWHEASIRPMGVKCHRTPGLFFREPMHPSIYEWAFVLSRRAEYPAILEEIEQMVKRFPSERIGIYDSFYELDLRPLGFEKWRNEVWMWRDAADSPDDSPPELRIQRVTTQADLEQFEVATLTGMENTQALQRHTPGAIHHPDTLSDQRMHYYIGRVSGCAVTSSIAYVSDTEVGVYGVSTLPEFRKHGYGKAITRAAILAAPHLPAAIAPAPEAYSVYYQLGFRYVGEFNRWRRQPRQ